MRRLLILILFLFSVIAVAAQQKGVVNVSVTDMKTGAGYSKETISQATLGTPVEIIDHTGYWYKIVTPEGYQGWTTEKNVTLMSKERFSQWKSSERWIVTDYFVVVYNRADKCSAVIGDCVMGNILEKGVKECAEGFVSVLFPDGREGYIEEKYVADFSEWIDSRNPTEENIVNVALKFVGFPYLWGGLSPKGFDCSGLVKFSYFMNGIILLRDAREQIHTGEALDYSDILANLRMGDLVFFGTPATSQKPAKVTHVGLYIADGEIVHSSLMVRRNSLLQGREDSYTSKPVVGAARMLGYQDKDKDIVTIANHPWYF